MLSMILLWLLIWQISIYNFIKFIRVIVYEGTPGLSCTANAPQDLVSGMNKFLSLMSVTFRRDPENFRPRINKIGSTLDRE